MIHSLAVFRYSLPEKREVFFPVMITILLNARSHKNCQGRDTQRRGEVRRPGIAGNKQAKQREESGAFLQEFRNFRFREIRVLRTSRNARTKHPWLVAAEVTARK